MLHSRIFVVVLGASGCVAYHPQPLFAPVRAPEAASDFKLRRSEPKALRLQAPASELRNVNLGSIKVNVADGLSADEAAVLAVLMNPELRAKRAEHGVAQAQVLAAGILPNPVLGVEFDHPYGSSSEGTNNVLNLSLSQDIKPFFGRAARRESASEAVAQVDLGIAWEEWQVAERARLLVVRCSWLEERTKLARTEMEVEQATADALLRSAAAGDATLEQVGIQRVALEGVRRTLRELEQTALETDGELRALLGYSGQAEIRVPSPDLPGVSSSTPAEECLRRRFDLRALARGYGAEEAAVRAATLDQFPDLTVGLTHQHNEASLNFVGAFVNIGLPLFDRNQARVATEVATRERLRFEYDARVASIRADLARMASFSELVRRQLADATAALSPLEKLEADERRAMDRGDLNRQAYQAVRSAWFDQRLEIAALSQALVESSLAFLATCGGAAPSAGGSP